MPIRDSPFAHPTPCPLPGPFKDGPSMGWGRVGVATPLWVYSHIGYMVLDMCFVNTIDITN